MRDGRAALLFLVPGSDTTIRVNGRAHVSVDPQLCESFAIDGRQPRSVIVLTIEAVFFQCARCIKRSDLWNPARHVDPRSLPTPGRILAVTSASRIDGDAYDAEWPARAEKSMW